MRAGTRWGLWRRASAGAGAGCTPIRLGGLFWRGGGAGAASPPPPRAAAPPPPLAGLGAAAMLAAGHVTGMLLLGLVLLAGLAVAVRNPYGMVAVLATGPPLPSSACMPRH